MKRGRKMKRAKRLLPVLTAFCLMLSSGFTSLAAGAYTYTVTISAGDQGTLRVDDGVSISVEGGGDYEVLRSEDGKTVQITGLTSENHVRFLNSAAVLSNDSKYYVKGIRKGGRDNVDLSYFRVERDQDYVVAYGIKGNMVQYTVNYVDAYGNALYPSQTYYGNVGDRPVAAYLYVEGYQPQAYNLTGTLQSDASKNIFTFVYRQIVVEQPGEPAPGGNEPGGDETPGGNVPGGGEAPAGNVPGGNVPGGNVPGGNIPGGNVPGGNEPEEDVPGGEESDFPESDLPQGQIPDPEEVIDINDEDLPQGGFDDNGTIVAANREHIRNKWIAIGVGIAAAAFLGAGLYIFLRMGRSEEKEQEE